MLNTMPGKVIKFQGEGTFVLRTVLAQKGFIAKPEYSLMSPAKAKGTWSTQRSPDPQQTQTQAV